MISNKNICSRIGDTIFFETSPIWGMVRRFNTFIEDIEGISPERYFKRSFRYSYDGGLNYTEWLDLAEESLKTIFSEWLHQNKDFLSLKLDEQSDLKLQFRYERVGTDDTGELKLKSLTINGKFLPRELEFTTLKNSIFSEIIDNNIDLFDVTMNLVKKMYEKGIMAEYVERNSEDDRNLLEDRDYIDFWRMVSEFYSMMFLHVLKFTNIYWKKDLIHEYLIQHGIILCDCDDIVEMQLISQNFYDEIRLRGTAEIFKKKGHQYTIGRRKSYRSFPGSLRISRNTPIIIDGVTYETEASLPYGWTVEKLRLLPDIDYIQLISNSLNYHEVFFASYNEDGTINKVEAQEIKILEATEDSGIFKSFNGEYLRLICFSNACDEFIYNQVNIKDFGWNIGNSSPMYKGLDDQYGTIVKAYEYMKDFTVLSKYPWFGYVSITIDEIEEYCLPIIKNGSNVQDETCFAILLTNSEITI